MRIGYLFRGFLGDVKLGSDFKPVSSPDGNATYSWTIEHECYRRGYKLIPLGPNLDMPAASTLGEQVFSSFSPKKRLRSYERMIRNGWMNLSDKKFPEIDLLLIEWRWSIPGRNTPSDRSSPNFQPDLDRQSEVFEHYAALGTPMIIWDLDHKLTAGDELRIAPYASIIETSVSPRVITTVRHRVEPPTHTNDLLQFDIVEKTPSHHLGYIGSRYERDEVIDRWINPIAPPNSHRVKFWGKWEPDAEVRARWPGVKFGKRITAAEFRLAYSSCAVVPLLAKQSYLDCGFMTPRIPEAIIFGSIPVGLTEHRGIDDYVVKVATNPQDLLDYGTWVRNFSPVRRRCLREEAAHKISHMDAKHFVDVLEKLANPEPENDSRDND